ncbi:hypothetical protein HN014_08665 [Aquimarina sp. TRL1]|uniref:VOC family protein n=1 Tax=Aquimarina sp. (strain TRL1) TaxID=2736252 RepID=UPI00158A82A9|nr:VOC family protein [Aquimarina sp. TRL1]QKX04984.1 hypothetical protein HN014_08665 [Aquimarina sp. TRL1]
MLQCSHILCKVDNIHKLVEDYTKLGFSLIWGSRKEKAHNALLWFEEGPYIEFFQLPKKFEVLSYPLKMFYGRGAGDRWTKWSKSPEGWCDMALESQETILATSFMPPVDLKAIKKEMDKTGVRSSRIIKNKRVSPEGVKIKYSIFCPNATGFPFVFSGYDSPQKPEKIKHPNGATKINWVKMGVDSTYTEEFHHLIRTTPFIKTIPDTETKVFEVGLTGLRNELDPQLLHGAVFKTS